MNRKPSKPPLRWKEQPCFFPLFFYTQQFQANPSSKFELQAMEAMDGFQSFKLVQKDQGSAGGSHLRTCRRGFPARHGGTPIAGWFMRDNPNQTWMMTGGTPISGKYHMLAAFQARPNASNIKPKRNDGFPTSWPLKSLGSWK